MKNANLKTIFPPILKNTSFYFFIFLIIFTFDRHHRYEASTNPNKYGPFESDVAEYYSFLPAIFYQNDSASTLNFKNNKRTIGMAIMYSPAFLVGHIIATQTGDIKDGYSSPYKWSIRWGSIIFCIGGLLFCRKSLLLFFKDEIVTISLASIFFGTNLLYYTYSSGEMPHSYLFFLYSAFIFICLKLILNKKQKNLILIGLLGGIITLIRPTDILIILFPLFFKVHNFNEFKNRIKIFFSDLFVLSISILAFLLPLLLQMVLWKQYVGTFIYYSYANERFFFNDPQIINFLFSYRKGWLLYTPIMTISIVGILLSKKQLNDFFIFLIVFVPLNIYILSCWWDWSFGGSFGCRALIQSYAVLIFPFAAMISWFWQLGKKKKFLNEISKTGITLLLFLLIKANLIQTMQYKWLVIHWSGMNEITYKYIFLREDLSAKELDYIRSTPTPPDIEKMRNGERD